MKIRQMCLFGCSVNRVADTDERQSYVDNMLYIIPLLTSMAMDDDFSRDLLTDAMNDVRELGRYVVGLTTFIQCLAHEVAEYEDTSILEVFQRWGNTLSMFTIEQLEEDLKDDEDEF